MVQMRNERDLATGVVGLCCDCDGTSQVRVQQIFLQKKRDGRKSKWGMHLRATVVRFATFLAEKGLIWAATFFGTL